MKKNSILLLLIFIVFSLMAQSPSRINYQTVIRDGNGQPLSNTEISLKMTIRAGGVDGVVVYAETHDATSNSLGLVNLKLGMGNPVTGEFPEISWGTSSHFLETAVDLDGTGVFQVLGVSQFLSVPYSLFSGVAAGILTMTTQERDEIDFPQVGMQIYNTTTNCLNYYSGSAWMTMCGTCEPMPNQADAGEDQISVTGTTTSLEGNSPNPGNGIWSIQSGEGGSFADATNPLTSFTGLQDKAYILTWTISTACGSSSDEVIISFGEGGWTCGMDYKDSRDNQVYPSVKIGDQCWMAKNLNVGTTILGSTSMADNSLVEKYCQMDNELNCAVYGGLYTWDEMMEYTTIPAGQGICPAGWHIPTDADWCTLTTYLDATVECSESGWLGTDAGGKMKEAGTSHWLSPNTGATNSSGFNGLPGGSHNYTGTFDNMTSFGFFWSSMQSGSGTAWYNYLHTNSATVARYNGSKNSGFSVRCILNDEAITSELTVTPANHDVSTAQGSVTFNVSSNVSWIVEESVSWFSLNPSSGSNDGAFTVGYEANTAPESRSGEIIVTASGGNPVVTVTVTQAGTSSNFTCGQDLTDTRNGEVYPTVQISDQCWMAKNLNIGTRINGTIEMTDNETIEKYCFYNDDNNCNLIGGLYQWGEIMEYSTTQSVQGICPPGWQIPSHDDFMALINFLGGESLAGGALKATGTFEGGTGLWMAPNGGATNSSSFSALGAGARGTDGLYYESFENAYFWSSTNGSSYYPAGPIHLKLNNQNAVAEIDDLSEQFGFSVRCVRNDASSAQLEVTPSNQDVSVQAGYVNFEIASNTLWEITEIVDWLSVSPSNGSNDGTFTVLYEENNGLEPRTGEIVATASGGNPVVTVTVNQAGTSSNFTCGQDFTDTRDGNNYPTIKISDQCWMAKNLNFGTKINSSSISSNDGATEKYCYNNLSLNCLVYGGLYKWDEMMDYTETEGTQGICPEGWHLPGFSEYTVLVENLGGASQAGGALKETGYEHWLEPNNGATNSSGFTALPAGLLQANGTFTQLESFNYLWSSTLFNTSNSNYFQLSTNYTDVYTGNFSKTAAFSVRCIKDGSATSLLDVTPENQNVNYDAGTTSFEVISNVAWTVEENISWLSISTLSGNGNQTVTVVYDENTNTATRTGEITFSTGGGVFTIVSTITQVGYSPTFCGVEFLDMRNGEIYPTVKIGNQCWFAKNLNIGTLVQEIETQTNNNNIEKYCHENNNLNCSEYGGLYLWDEMMNYTTIEGDQGICPGGWHIPSDSEWTTLEEFLGGPNIAGGKLKEMGFDHWIEPNTGATNTSGFTALPGGVRSPSGFVGSPGYAGNWWSSTQLYDPSLVWYRYFYYSHGISSRYSETKDNGYSVRCLKDE